MSRITFEKLTEIFKYICGLRNNETISSITKVHHFEIYGFQNLKSTLTYRFYTLGKSPLSIKKNGEKNVSKSPARRANEIRTNPAKQAGETKERPLGNRKGRQGAIANPFLFAFISILSPENKKYPFVLRAGQQPDRRQSQ